MRIKFLWVGKTKNTFLKSLLSDYLARICHLVPAEIVETRDLSKMRALRPLDLVEAEASELARHIPESGCLVALDERGIPLSSADFARWLESEQNRGSRAITFVIGGPEGLSRTIIDRAQMVLSMGKMTWTHDMCRVLLLEQIYRAFCILRRIPYHKGTD